MTNMLIHRKLTPVITLLILLISFSCSDEGGKPVDKGQIQFNFSPTESVKGRIKTGATSLLISVKDKSGSLVYEKKKVALFNFSGQFISEPIGLKAGNYSLTEFLVLDESNTVIYATPLKSSKLAYLVKNALAIDFAITKDTTIKISPEVLSIDTTKPFDFGYTTFSFNIVKTFNFQVAVFAYNDAVKNFELTTSTLTVTANDSIRFSNNLPDSTNIIRVKDGYANYTLNVAKNNYATYTKTFSSAELKTYAVEKVLIINLLQKGLQDGLVGEYLYNGNTFDTSGKDHHGTNSGCLLTSDRKGALNSAYLFNGANGTHITIPNNTDMNFSTSQDFSISLWTVVDPTQVLDGGINDIVRKWNGDAQGYPFAIAYINSAAAANVGKFIYVRYDGAGCSNVPTSYSSVVSTNSFHHIVCLKSGNKIRQYLDNVLVSEIADNTSCVTTNTSDITIGCRGQLARFFTGKIDDIRIYNRTLSSTEIDALYKE